MTVFKDFEIDDERVRELIRQGNYSDALYFFKVKGGRVNMPIMDTTWQELRGWTSCYELFNFDAFSENGLSMELPAEFAPECNCLTCPEVKVLVDSLFDQYSGFCRINLGIN